MAMTNAERARRLAEKIAEQVRRGAGKGLNAGRIFLAARIKEMLSIPAPRKRVKTGGGDIYYRATAPAIPGAPPRKLSGKLRQSVTSEMRGQDRAVVGVSARSVKNFNYPLYHEVKGQGQLSGRHPFMLPTLAKYRAELKKILGRGISIALRGG